MKIHTFAIGRFLALLTMASLAFTLRPAQAAPSPFGTGLSTGIHLGNVQNTGAFQRKWGTDTGYVINYDVDLSTWPVDIYVPPSYDGTKPYGVVVTISSNVTGVILSTAADDKNLIWIAPQHVDNGADPNARFGVGLMSLYRAKELFNIDPRRVYISGLSGGSRVAEALAFLHPELIRGTAPSSGICVPRYSANQVVPNYIPDTSTDTDTYYDYSKGYFFSAWGFSDSDLANINATAIANKQRHYLLTRYSDHREDYIVEAYHCAYEPQGATAFLYDGPGGHQDASNSEMEEAIDYLDRNDTFPVNANILSGSNGFSGMTNISQPGATAVSTTTKGNTSFTLTPTLNAVAAIKSGSSFYWDNANGSTLRWLWEVKNSAPTNQKTCFGLWFTGETWGGGAPVSVTSGTNPGILVNIYQTVTSGTAINRLVVSARPDSGGESVLYDGYFSFVPTYSTPYTSTQSGYISAVGGGSPVELRLDLNQKRWQLTFNGIRLSSNNTVARGTQIGDDNRLVFGYWDSVLSTPFWKHGLYTSWNNTWSPFTKSIFTAATGAISSTGATPAAMDLRYVIASDPGLPNPLPPGPDKVYASGYNGSVKLSWTASSGATSYNVKRSGTLNGIYSVIATGTALNYTDTAVTNGSTYYYVVTAQTANGESAIGPVVRATPDSNSLIAQLLFDESSGTVASDSTGHGWNGSLINGAGWSAGRINNALSLTGSRSQYATLPSGVVQGVTDCTISAWINPSTLSNWMRVFDFGTGTGNYMFLAPRGGSSHVRLAILTPSVPGGEQFIESSGTISAGVWTHLAVTISGTVGTLYVNGTVAGTNNSLQVSPAILGITTQNYIGKSQFNDPYFDGLIDHFQIHSRALSASEVAALASAAAPPNAPGGLAASGSNSSVSLRWAASSGATSYNVKRSTTSGSGYVTIATPTSLAFVDTGAVNGTTYYYVVSAVSSTGESANSSEVRANPDSNSLVAFLRFDESTGTVAADSTGHGWNGSLLNGAGWSPGKINNALSLAGSSSQYVSLPSGVAKGMTDCSISAWVQLNTVTNWMRIFDFGTGTTTYMFLSPQNGATAKARFAITTSGGGGEQKIDASSAIPTGTWTHVAVTLSGSIGTIYLNGVASGTNTAMTLTPASLGNTTFNYIGKSQYSDPYLNGLVDHFQIFGRALSAAEVGALASSVASPGGVVATSGNASASLSWNAVAGATGYNVYRSLTSGLGYSTVATAVSGTSYVDTGLTNGSTYFYVVTALNGGAESSNSFQTSAVPNANSTLPRFSFSGDIGSPGATGTTSLVSGTYTMQGAGADIWGTADAFQFMYQQVTGDCDVRVRVLSVQNTNAWAKAGVMIRNTLDAGSQFADVFVSPTSGVAGQWRSATNGSCGGAGVSGLAAPYWVRLVRSGSTFTYYDSPDGTTWSTVTTNSIAMNSTVYVGLAVTSHVAGTICTATMDNFSVVALPNPWASTDVGTVGSAGSAKLTGSTFTIAGSGADIWSNADAFRYVYQPSTGDCDITARVTDLSATDVSAKAVVMIRESLNADSAHAMVIMTPSSGIHFQWRSATGASTSSVPGPTIAAPCWIRLVRSGSTFTGYYSTDGTNWTSISSATITMASSANIGLGVTSHSDGVLCTATLDNVTANP